MTSKLVLDNIAGRTTAGSIAVVGEGNGTTTNLQQGLAKSWCNWATASSFSIYDSYNIASLTDNGAGNTKPVLTSVMNNDDYSYIGFSNETNYMGNNDERTTATFKLLSQNSSHSNTDCSDNNVAVFGDLA